MSKRRLSEKQRRIIELIADGYDTEGIAREMGVSKWTVRDHVRKLSREYDCSFKDLPRRTGLRQRRGDGTGQA